MMVDFLGCWQQTDTWAWIDLYKIIGVLVRQLWHWWADHLDAYNISSSVCSIMLFIFTLKPKPLRHSYRSLCSCSFPYLFYLGDEHAIFHHPLIPHSSGRICFILYPCLLHLFFYSALLSALSSTGFDHSNLRLLYYLWLQVYLLFELLQFEVGSLPADWSSGVWSQLTGFLCSFGGEPSSWMKSVAARQGWLLASCCEKCPYYR